MLPKKVAGHPYFHQGISKEEAGELLKTLPQQEGNCLFCEDKEDENKFFFVYRTSQNEIKLLPLMLAQDMGYEKIYCVADYKTTTGENYLSLYHFIQTLPQHIEYVSASYPAHLKESLEKTYEDLAGFRPEKFASFKDQPLSPVLSPTAKKRLEHAPAQNSMLAPLSNEIVRLIFDYLDKDSSLKAATVAKSWTGLFHLNLNSIIKTHHDDTKNKADDVARKRRCVYE